MAPVIKEQIPAPQSANHTELMAEHHLPARYELDREQERALEKYSWVENLQGEGGGSVSSKWGCCALAVSAGLDINKRLEFETQRSSDIHFATSFLTVFYSW